MIYIFFKFYLSSSSFFQLKKLFEIDEKLTTKIELISILYAYADDTSVQSRKMLEFQKIKRVYEQKNNLYIYLKKKR
jgi:hypothetical protein